ncbi:MAG: hypothetical protein RBS43_08790, partial [Candidatus Cloacimonas sp.]|nr:hypothetical protein [Candidatus Cloacimonas sp.]
MDKSNYPLAIRQANQLFQNKDYQAALIIYEDLYQDTILQDDFSLLNSLVNTYKNLKAYSFAITLALPHCEKINCPESIKQTLAWCMYFEYFKRANPIPIEEAILHIEKQLQLFPLRQGLHPLPLSIFKFIDSSIALSPSARIQLLDFLNPTLLAVNLKTGSKPNTSFPSDREKYCTLLSKALFENQDYLRCIGLCTEMMQSGIPLSPNQDIWLKRRIALCKAKTGEMEEAFQMLSELSKQKPEWYILYECALAAYRLQRYDDSFAYAVQAASAFGKVEVKIHLWELMKDLFAIQKRFDDSIAMVKLQAAIRIQMHWSISNSLSQELSSYNIIPDALANFRKLFLELCANVPELNNTHTNYQQIKHNPSGKNQKPSPSITDGESKQGT